MKPYSSLFFNPHFAQEINWRNERLRIGTITPSNKEQISKGLRDLSPESIRNRFLGSKRHFTEKELSYLTELDGWNHYAMGIEVQDHYKRGIAVIRMVRSSHDPHEAEVAITIIDEYQKMGLGSLLLKLMILAAGEREIDRLSFTFLPQNSGIIKLIHSIARPVPGTTGHDSTQLFLNLKELDMSKIKQDLKICMEFIETKD